MDSEIRHGIKSNYLSHVLSDSGMGYIHSIFKHSFNLTFHGKLIHFDKQEVGISSFGILIPYEKMEALLLSLRLNDRVAIRPDYMRIYTRENTWKIHLSSFETVDCRIPVLRGKMDTDFLQSVLDKFRLLNLESKTGVLDSERSRLLLEAFVETDWKDERFHRSFITHFVGRGIGLTPSGDDMLMGVLMVYEALEIKGNWMETLKKQLDLIQTTDVSMAYYRTLLEGYTSSYFVDLLKAFQRQDFSEWELLIDRISHYGHSSGWDTLYGIYLFFQKMRDTWPEKKEDKRSS